MKTGHFRATVANLLICNSAFSRHSLRAMYSETIESLPVRMNRLRLKSSLEDKEPGHLLEFSVYPHLSLMSSLHDWPFPGWPFSAPFPLVLVLGWYCLCPTCWEVQDTGIKNNCMHQCHICQLNRSVLEEFGVKNNTYGPGRPQSFIRSRIWTDMNEGQDLVDEMARSRSMYSVCEECNVDWCVDCTVLRLGEVEGIGSFILSFNNHIWSINSRVKWFEHYSESHRELLAPSVLCLCGLHPFFSGQNTNPAWCVKAPGWPESRLVISAIYLASVIQRLLLLSFPTCILFIQTINFGGQSHILHLVLPSEPYGAWDVICTHWMFTNMSMIIHILLMPFLGHTWRPSHVHVKALFWRVTCFYSLPCLLFRSPMLETLSKSRETWKELWWKSFMCLWTRCRTFQSTGASPSLLSLSIR